MFLLFIYLFKSQKIKVEEVMLWKVLSGDTSGLEISGRANDPESGHPAPCEMKVL